ncbi:uncharacterized protein LOC134278435 [Saccostrea cucullata]|uniref:uncharacterized protein LOC134278435 n=1 Tax=Saccostrea cuccullata TaxID=36930 RepID=UPI002ED4524D
MSFVSPAKPPKKKKRTKSKKGGQEDNMATNMPGPPSQSQITPSMSNMCSNTVPMQYSSIPSPSMQPPQGFVSMNPTQMHVQPNFQSNIQSNIPVTSSGVPPQWAMEIFSRLDGISRRLEKLDSIESSLITMQNQVKSLTSRVSEVEKSQEFITKTVDDSDKNTRKALSEINNLKIALDDSMYANSLMKEEILDLQCRSMRDNLLFYNIKEPSGDETEDCVSIIQDICSSVLEIEGKVDIERAHRIGRKVTGKIRPVVVKFTRFPQKELVRKNAFKLKESELSISEQFPKEIQERRKKLLPVLKKAKDDKKKASLVKDKLYIEGKLYRQDQAMDIAEHRGPQRS